MSAASEATSLLAEKHKAHLWQISRREAFGKQLRPGYSAAEISHLERRT
jgi:hypothetical protein